MITIPSLKDKKVAVVGLGKSGSSAIEALKASGAIIYAWDDGEAGRAVVKDAIVSPHVMQEPETFPWQEMECLVLAAGIPLTHPKPHSVVAMAKNADCPIICDAELLYRARPNCAFIGITGTNGKSTTTTLIHHVLHHAGKEVEVGGNLGFAALSLKPLSDDGTYVVEMSSYMLDLLDEMHFKTSVWLNITPDHLDRHGDIEGYVRAKLHIFDRQGEGDTVAIGVDDDYSKRVYTGLCAQGRVEHVVPISCKAEVPDGVAVIDGEIIDRSGAQEKRYTLGALPYLPGAHNAQNIAAAYVACRSMGVKPDIIVEAVKKFKGLRHRIQLVREKDGVRFVNDSKATNADATEKALLAYDDIYWIAGGVAKEGGITMLAPYFSKIKKAYLIGECAQEFAKTLEGEVEYQQCEALEKALRAAADDALKAGKGVVLLSPACASFDQWKSFEARGDAFCDIVEAL